MDYYTDPAVESVADECSTCGCWVLNPALHRDWHDEQRQRMNAVEREARRYKEPPRYGG